MSQWHHPVPALTGGIRFPGNGFTGLGPGETAGRSPRHLLPFVEQTLIQKRGEGCSPPPSSPPLHSLLLFSYLCFGKHFSKNISLVIQSLLHLPNLLFIQERQRCHVITTCPKEGKQLESNPLCLFYTVPSAFGSVMPYFLLLLLFPSRTYPVTHLLIFVPLLPEKHSQTESLQWCYLFWEKGKIAGFA